jgi:hypothetical protein
MTREQLEHILRASAAITGANEIVVVGSQSILGAFPRPPSPVLTQSVEADVFTFRSPDDAQLIDGSIGEGSPFHHTFGYYAHGVGEETATLPSGWKERLVRVRSPATGAATGLCLEAHDLAASKLAAGRPSDIDYVTEMLRHGLIERDVLATRLATIAGPDRSLAVERLARLK